MIFSMMVAMAENRVIGYQNGLPWHLPADMAHFRKVTMGKAILMGRKTFDSIGRPLPGRDNIVLSRQKDLAFKGCHVYHTVEQAMQFQGKELICIGGSQLYQLCMPYVQRLYLTEIAASFAGDAFFPDLDLGDWKQVDILKYDPDTHNKWPYCFSTWERG